MSFVTARRGIRIGWVVLVFLAAAGCRSAAPEPTSTPYPTSTPVTFEIPDIAPVFGARGLLPPLASGADLSDVPHPSFRNMPAADGFNSVRYESGGDFAGRLSVFFYLRPEDMDLAWTAVLDTIQTPKEVTGIGDLAAVNHSDAAFIRCFALVHIKLAFGGPPEVRVFAEQVDADLWPLVCPE